MHFNLIFTFLSLNYLILCRACPAVTLGIIQLEYVE